MVADGKRTCENIESASGAVAARRRESGGRSRTCMAACERIEIVSGACVPVFLLAHCQQMPAAWRYRGRAVTADDILFIRQLIAQNPRFSRRKLSAKLCEEWN